MENAMRLEESIQEIKGPILKRGVQPVHKAFADYMLMNPGCTLREMGQVFNYSISWISQVTNSDMFKAYFEQRRQGIDCAIAADLPERLRAAACLATERVMEVLEKTNDADTIIDAFDKVLHRYGYAPNAKGVAQQAVVQQQNVFFLDKGDFAQARQQLMQSHQSPMPEVEVKGEVLESSPVSAA